VRILARHDAEKGKGWIRIRFQTTSGAHYLTNLGNSSAYIEVGLVTLQEGTQP